MPTEFTNLKQHGHRAPLSQSNVYENVGYYAHYILYNDVHFVGLNFVASQLSDPLKFTAIRMPL